MNYYIASCVFTRTFPRLSAAIQKYAVSRGLTVVRCCVPGYKLKEFTDQMLPELQGAWSALPDSAPFGTGDTVYSLCHNCSAIVDEWRPGAVARSLWDLIDGDEEFPFPDLKGRELFVQDCWRSRDRAEEQRAVRNLLQKSNARVRELPEHGEKTEFCGVSLLRPAPPRNLKLAPRRFVENAAGKFTPHTPEQQRQIMAEYCTRFGDAPVVDYCHYCHEGLLLGGAQAFHLAQLLFAAAE